MPARYRDRLQETCDGRMVITVDPDRCLLVYPMPEWEKIEQQLNKLPSFNRRARALQRLLLGHATESEFDSQGRMLLPAMLRDYAGLQKKAVLIGQGNKFEVWDEETWNNKQSEWLDEMNGDDGELPDSLENLSL